MSWLAAGRAYVSKELDVIDTPMVGWPVQVFLSEISALFTVVALGILIHAIIKKRSKPYLLAWCIRVSLVGVAFLSQLTAGATYSLAMSGTQMIGGVFVIGLIALRQQSAGRLTRLDGFAIGMAGVGVVVWVLSGNPLHGLLGTILADMTATALGIHASLKHGTRESLPFWAFAFVAALAATFAAAGTDATNAAVLLAPLFSCVNAVTNIVACWYVRQRSIKYAAAQQPAVISES